MEALRLPKSLPIDSTRYAKLYPQSGERIVTIYSGKSIHPMYIDGHYVQTWCQIFSLPTAA